MGDESATCIALIGPSGAGKSTIGRLLAHQLGWQFIDLDGLIEQRAGLSVSAIFEQEGEAGFRERESAALVEALDGGPLVLACGGGVVMRVFNRKLLRERTWCVYLTSTIDSLAQRLSADEANPRPLLAESLVERLTVMVAERRPIYVSLAHWTVHTDGLAPATVASEIVRARHLTQRASPTEVYASGMTYEVKDGAYATLPDELARLGLGGTCWLVSDTSVGPLYAERVQTALQTAGLRCFSHLIPAHESSKSLDQAGELYTWLLANGVQRDDTLIALGGGVVGDLAGFVAASILRGIAVVQLPTTILAMIDSSIGGKTGVNHQRGKNLIGAFHPPRLVLLDAAVLPTLPRRERAAGWAEAIKHGVIADAALFADLEAAGAGLNDLPPNTGELLVRAAAVKIGVVNRDERESGERMLLNYGHTLGQAVEAATHYTRYLHGEAVAIGMTFAAELAVRRGLWSAEEAARQRAVLEAVELPTALPDDLDVEQTVAALNLDKKRARGVVRWVLPTAIGRAQVDAGVPQQLIRELLSELLAR